MPASTAGARTPANSSRKRVSEPHGIGHTIVDEHADHAGDIVQGGQRLVVPLPNRDRGVERGAVVLYRDRRRPVVGASELDEEDVTGLRPVDDRGCCVDLDQVVHAADIDAVKDVGPDVDPGSVQVKLDSDGPAVAGVYRHPDLVAMRSRRRGIRDEEGGVVVG